MNPRRLNVGGIKISDITRAIFFESCNVKSLFRSEECF